MKLLKKWYENFLKNIEVANKENFNDKKFKNWNIQLLCDLIILRYKTNVKEITSMEEPKINIIIADDSKEFCNVLNAYLSEQKDIVVTGIAKNGVEALKLIEEKKPDLVLLDMIMPIVDGLGVLKKLNTMDLKPKPRIIVLSVVTQDKVDEKAMSLGADYYFVKPFDIELLIKKIRQTLNKPYSYDIKKT